MPFRHCHPCLPLPLLGLAVLVLAIAAAPQAATAAQINAVSVQRQTDHRSAVEGRVEGVLQAPYGAVVAVLCDFDTYPKFSETTKRQAMVAAAAVAELKAKLAADPDSVADNEDVAGYVREGVLKPNCPQGENYVMALQEFPWPVGDAWMVSRYTASETSAGFRMLYETLTGTGLADGAWEVRPHSGGTTWVKNNYRFDPGIKLPEFLIRMGSERQLPDLLHLLEREAQARAAADPTLAQRQPATATATTPSPATAATAVSQ